MKIALLILAAGTSSRMKTAKQLLPIRDKTLLEISLRTALKTNIEAVFCILGANAGVIRDSITQYDIEIITNTNFKKGLSSSINCGIQHIGQLNFDAALIILGDQPNITSEYLNELISNFEKNPDFIYASNYPEKNGVPAIFPRKYFTDLLKLHGEKGAGDFLNNEITAVKNIDMQVDLLDIDTPEEYKKFIQ